MSNCNTIFQGIEDSLSIAKVAKIDSLKTEITAEQGIAPSLSQISELFAIDKEIGALSRELAFRQAKLDAQNAVTSELDQLVLMEKQVASMEKDMLVNEILKGVMADVEGQEAAILKQCVVDLESLSAAQ